MADKVNLEDFFKSEAYANSFKRGEMITRPFAEILVDQSKVIAESKANPDQPLVILDNACGTGIISSILNDKVDDIVKGKWKLTSGDISSAMIEYTKLRMQQEGWKNTETRILDAQKPDLPSAQFTHIFTAFGELVLDAL
jgi:ubiquinone/menaquinone biosynthesis C-methylase UbiE